MMRTDYNVMVQQKMLIYSFKVVSTNNKSLQPKFPILVINFRSNSHRGVQPQCTTATSDPYQRRNISDTLEQLQSPCMHWEEHRHHTYRLL